MTVFERTRIVLAGLVALAGACKDDATAAAPTETKAAEASGTEAKTGETKDVAVAPAAAAVAPAEPPPTGHAVAKVGALLFSSSTGDVGFELPPLAAAAGMTVNVVGAQDGRLVIETLVTEPTAEHHCAATLDGLSDFRLRLYLAETDLLPVLTETLVHEPGDGTTVRIARGVPVPAGSAELLVRGTAIRVPVPAERLGRFYEPAQPFAKEGSDGTLASHDGHALTYGGQGLAEDWLYHEGGKLLRFGATERTGDALVTVRNPCLELTALVSTERLHGPPPSTGLYAMKPSSEGHFLASPYGGAFAVGGDDEDVWGGLTGTEVGEAYGVGGLGLVGTGRGTTKGYEVKAGAAITWADGRPAGQVMADHVFSAAPRDEGGRSCFDAPLVVGQATTVTLCFAPGDVGEKEVSAGLGTLGSTGLIGTGSGTSPSTGSGFGGRGKKVPQVRQAKAAVAGSLDKDIIRRIVRAHINEVRYCYNQGLVRDPTLAGKVSISFIVGPKGDVTSATVKDSTIKDENVSSCITKAVKRWTFPKPTGGGVVAVTYPFVLEPG